MTEDPRQPKRLDILRMSDDELNEFYDKVGGSQAQAFWLAEIRARATDRHDKNMRIVSYVTLLVSLIALAVSIIMARDGS